MADATENPQQAAIQRTIELAFLGHLARMAVVHGESLYMGEEEQATLSPNGRFRHAHETII